MSQSSSEGGGTAGGTSGVDGDQLRVHPEDPAEGASDDQAAESPVPQEHSQDPAEG